MIGAVARTTCPLIDMSVLARWKIRPRLMGVPGVANVAIWGQRDRQLQVQVDPERLQAQRRHARPRSSRPRATRCGCRPLTFVEASTPGTGGFVETPNQRLGVQHISPITTAEELADVAVEGVPGAPRPARRRATSSRTTSR